MSRVLPILFNMEMVRAILDGRKSCTRRIIKPQWEECPHCKYVHKEYIYGKLAENVYCAKCGYPLLPERRAPYQPGDILYVRESWHKYIKRVGEGKSCHLVEFYGYKASIANSEDADEPWKPSIHMPKEAARIWLKVTNVRVELLKEITIDGIRNEGLSSMAVHAGDMEIAMEEWKNLWNSTIKKSDINHYGWNANPWVWVIEFERCEKPEGV